MTFTFKATNVHTNIVKLLRYVACQTPECSGNICISSITAVAAQRIAIKCYNRYKYYTFHGDLYVGMVTLVFLCDIETVHFFSTKKPKLEDRI